MKRLISLVLSAALLLMSVLLPVSVTADDGIIVDIPDQKLRAVLLEDWDTNHDKKLSEKEMANIEDIVAPDCGIKSLEGLQYCESLNYVDLTNNSISDLSPLYQIDYIGTLLISDNNISSLYPLRSTYLETIVFDNNKVSDISPLANSKYLEVVHFANNKVSNISALSGMTFLNSLRMNSNPVSDLSPIKDIPDLSNLEISSMSNYKTAMLGFIPASLVAIDICGNGATDISSLSRLKDLFFLLASDNSISNISALSGMTKMIGLELDNNNITDISPLKSMTKLQTLTASNNKISDISALSPMKELSGIYIANNNISNLSPLSSLPGLYKLDLCRNKIKSISPLKNKKTIEAIDLSHNEITDFSPLTTLENMVFCNYSYNKAAYNQSFADTYDVVSNIIWANTNNPDDFHIPKLLFASGQNGSVPGDMDGDGKVNTFDALILLKYSIGIIGYNDLSVEAMINSDINGDLFSTSEDALLLLKMSVGIIKEAPCEDIMTSCLKYVEEAWIATMPGFSPD